MTGIWTAVAIGGSAVLGAAASQSAAGAQADAAGKASGVTLDMFNKTRSDLSPWMQTGGQANDLMSLYMGLGGGGGGGAGAAPTRAQFTSAPNQGLLNMQFPGGQSSGGDSGRGSGINQPWWLQHPEQMAHPEQASQSFAGGGGQFNQGGYDQAMAGWNAQNAGLSQGQRDRMSDPRYGSLLKPFTLQDFQQSPAYQFNLQQGEQAISKASNARGNMYAPQTLQDLGKFQQGLASNEFQNALGNYRNQQGDVFGRLQNVSSGGQNAAAQVGNFGANAAGQVGNNIMGAGNAQAAGMIGGANAISAGVGQYYNNQFLNQYLKNQQRSSLASD